MDLAPPHRIAAALLAVVAPMAELAPQMTTRPLARVTMELVVLQHVQAKFEDMLRKLNLVNFQGVLSREEMRMIMAGSGSVTCSASASGCANTKCGCDGSGTCTGDTYSATCTCQTDGGGSKTTTVSCPNT